MLKHAFIRHTRHTIGPALRAGNELHAQFLVKSGIEAHIDQARAQAALESPTVHVTADQVDELRHILTIQGKLNTAALSQGMPTSLFGRADALTIETLQGRHDDGRSAHLVGLKAWNHCVDIALAGITPDTSVDLEERLKTYYLPLAIPQVPVRPSIQHPSPLELTRRAG